LSSLAIPVKKGLAVAFLGGFLLLLIGTALWAYPDPDWPSLPNVGLIFISFGLLGTVHALVLEHRIRATVKAVTQRR
jgi:hypothetical protein